MIGDLHLPVNLASIEHSLMLAGTKNHHGDSRDVFPPPGVIRLVVQPGAGHYTDTFQNNILHLSFPKFTILLCVKFNEF